MFQLDFPSYIFSGAPTPSNSNPFLSTCAAALASASRASRVAASSTSTGVAWYQVWKA